MAKNMDPRLAAHSGALTELAKIIAAKKKKANPGQMPAGPVPPGTQPPPQSVRAGAPVDKDGGALDQDRDAPEPGEQPEPTGEPDAYDPVARLFEARKKRATAPSMNRVFGGGKPLTASGLPKPPPAKPKPYGKT